MKKPPNFPPEIPGKSPTFSENFRKFPEIPENPGSRPRKIDHFGGIYKRLQPETSKKPPRFPPEILGKFRKSRKSQKFRKFRKFRKSRKSQKFRKFRRVPPGSTTSVDVSFHTYYLYALHHDIRANQEYTLLHYAGCKKNAFTGGKKFSETSITITVCHPGGVFKTHRYTDYLCNTTEFVYYSSVLWEHGPFSKPVT